MSQSISNVTWVWESINEPAGCGEDISSELRRLVESAVASLKATGASAVAAAISGRGALLRIRSRS